MYTVQYIMTSYNTSCMTGRSTASPRDYAETARDKRVSAWVEKFEFQVYYKIINDEMYDEKEYDKIRKHIIKNYMPEFRTDHIDSIEDAEIRAVKNVFYMRPTQIITKHNGKRVRVYENNSDEDIERFKNQPDSEWENRGIGKV